MPHGGSLGGQAQRDGGLDAERAAVAGEEPRQIGSEVPEEGRGVNLGGGTGVEHAAVGEHHLQRDDRIGGGAEQSRAPIDAVLGDAAADGGVDAGQGSPKRRSQSGLPQGVAEVRPGASGLRGHVHVLAVDLKHPVHGGRVHDHAVRFGRHVAGGIGHAAAAPDHRHTGAGHGRDGVAQLIHIVRPDHRARGQRAGEDILRVEHPRIFVRKDIGGGEYPLERGDQRFRQTHRSRMPMAALTNSPNQIAMT